MNAPGRPAGARPGASHGAAPKQAGLSPLRLSARLLAATLVAVFGGCAAVPPAPVVESSAARQTGAASAARPSAPVEYPPFEPVESPPAAARTPPTRDGSAAATDATRGPVPPAATPSTVPGAAGASPAAPTAAPPVAAAPAPAEATDEQLMAAVVADLQRYAQLSPDELRRELAAMTQALARQRSDANRVRLAVLYTMSRTAQDDQRALQLFDNVAKGGPGSPLVKQLALVLQVQVAERVRAVREEQQKADAAVQKLEALRAMERSLLRDRVRSGGGGGGGGGSGGGN